MSQVEEKFDRPGQLLRDLEHSEDLGYAELWDLLYAIEVATFERAEDRARLVPALLATAYRLRARSGEGPALLWSALRRYSSLVPKEEGLVLFDFIRPEDRFTVQICALQCLVILYMGRSPEGPSAEHIARLEALFATGSSAEVRGDLDGAVLAIEAAIVLGLLQPSRVKEMARIIASFEDASFSRMVSDKWHDAVRFRPKLEAALYKVAVGILCGEKIEEMKS